MPATSAPSVLVVDHASAGFIPALLYSWQSMPYRTMAQGTSSFLSASASLAGSRRHLASTSLSGTGTHGSVPGSPGGGAPASGSGIASVPASPALVPPAPPAPVLLEDADETPPPPPTPPVTSPFPLQPEMITNPKPSHRCIMR